MFETTEQVDKVLLALLAAQAEMKNPAFDSENPHFKNDYVSLKGVLEAILPILRRHGLGLFQNLSSGEGGPRIRTLVVHEESCQALVLCDITFPSEKKNAQGWGGAITYGRRYSLFTAFNLVGDYDDDANESSGLEKKPTPAPITASKPATVTKANTKSPPSR
jgi:hypothetical protein